jgi:hypothetical protein
MGSCVVVVRADNGRTLLRHTMKTASGLLVQWVQLNRKKKKKKKKKWVSLCRTRGWSCAQFDRNEHERLQSVKLTFGLSGPDFDDDPP